jgi:hypothetical protein
MEACSFNQLEIRPANVGDGGVVDVVIDINPIPDGSPNGNRGQLAQRAIAKTDEVYGGEDGLAAEFDLVIFCQPPGSGGWDAFAYFNRYDSYYNKNRLCILFCSYVHYCPLDEENILSFCANNLLFLQLLLIFIVTIAFFLQSQSWIITFW